MGYFIICQTRVHGAFALFEFVIFCDKFYGYFFTYCKFIEQIVDIIRIFYKNLLLKVV